MGRLAVLDEVQPVAPLLKWAGGKAWLVPKIVPEIAMLLRPGSRYIEPFAGGAAVALALNYAPMTLNDKLPILVDTYRAVQKAPSAVSWALSKMIDEGMDKATYLRVRARQPMSRVQRAAWLLYVNRLGFNGLYRENKAGGFNVPYGSPGSDPFAVVFERLPEVSVVLRGARLSCADFRDVIASAQRGDVIYADPPYDGDGFTSYTAAKFTADDQNDLAHALLNATLRGVHIFTTNADTGLVRRLYGEWAQIEPTREPRAINSKADDRGPTPCVLISASAR